MATPFASVSSVGRLTSSVVRAIGRTISLATDNLLRDFPESVPTKAEIESLVNTWRIERRVPRWMTRSAGSPDDSMNRLEGH
ncbi:hypothetical protein [Jiangella asiatica]|uniref:Uncharacterized protein n=1 Tax=Jiangella asiatica TaxID=2530372 RepID=A0A4R5DHJ6_9ACTN|nr:hypothetical protein [Jiangella asiatica]TDE13552.1 hypothetical protein E1269_05855 [Jiangella asiatica]